MSFSIKQTAENSRIVLVAPRLRFNTMHVKTRADRSCSLMLTLERDGVRRQRFACSAVMRRLLKAKRATRRLTAERLLLHHYLDVSKTRRNYERRFFSRSNFVLLCETTKYEAKKMDATSTRKLCNASFHVASCGARLSKAAID